MSDSTSSPRSGGPRVLAVTNEPPWPLNSGGHIRSFHMLKALAAGTDLRLMCPVQPHQREAIDALRAQGIRVCPAQVGARTKFGEASRLAGSLLRAEPYVMYRRHAWPQLAAGCEAEVASFRPDVLYLDHIAGFVYRSCAPSVPAVIDLHNVYSLLLRRTAEEQSSRLKRGFLRREAGLLDKAERRAARDCRAVFAVSRTEAEHFRGLGANEVHVMPNGVDCGALADLPVGRATAPPTVLFLGTMSWGPNAAAAKFLAADVMPRLRERFPTARLLLVGRDPPPDVTRLSGAGGVEVTGSVPDVKPYLLQASVMAVPLAAGGGTRLKILEGFAAGLPVVSTAVGAEGIDATPGVHLILAERPQFADAVAGLLTSREAGRIAGAARELAVATYDWGMIGRKAAEVVRGLAGSKSA